MEISNSVVKNGFVFNLPIGFRFHPTDEELVLHYLKRKVFSLPLPVSVIPDLDVFHLNPWNFSGNMKEKRYFFTRKDISLRKKKCWSKDCGGYWKRTNKEKQILDPSTNQTIGLKKSHVFYKMDGAGGLKTQWIMQEFCLVGSANQKIMIQVGDWVVCCVYQRKKRNWKLRNLGMEMAETTSCSSEITEVYSNELLDEEASSSSRGY